jgi:hypothetical protein
MEPQVKMSDPQARVYIEAVVAENELLHCCKIAELILDKYGISLNNKKISHVCNRYRIQYLKIKNHAENGKKINQEHPITQMILDVGSNAFLSYKEIRKKIKEKYGTDVHEGQIRNVLEPDAYIDKAVQGKKPEINQAFNQPKLRTCLTCKEEFLSDWIGNRVCQPCKQTSPYVNEANDSYSYRR